MNIAATDGTGKPGAVRGSVHVYNNVPRTALCPSFGHHKRQLSYRRPVLCENIEEIGRHTQITGGIQP